MNRKFLIGLAAILFLGVCFAGVGGYVLWKRKTPKTGDDLFAQGTARLELRDYAGAFGFFSAAVQRDPRNPSYSRDAARAAAFQGRLSEAQLYAQKAWENGLKEPDMLRLILGSYGVIDKTNAMPMALRLVSELPENYQREELRGDIYYQFNEPKAAFNTWQRTLAAEITNSALALKIATAFVARKEFAAAREFLEENRARGALNEESFSMLAYLYFQDENLDKTVQTFNAAKAAGKYRDRLTLEHSLVYLVNQRVDDARAVLEPVAFAGGEHGASGLRTQIRLFLGYVMLVRRDQEAIRKLRSIVDQLPGGPAKEAEQVFFAGLLQILNEKPEALESFAKARKLLSGQPVVELLYARENIRVRNYSAAIDALSDIRGILERWPPVNFQLAVAYHGNRQDRLALQTLSKLHKRKMVSKESLELFRDIAFQNNLANASKAAQDLLEKVFPNDANVQLFRGLSAMQQGSFNEATRIFQELGSKHPEDVRFQLGPIQILLAQGKYAEALQAGKSSPAPASSLGPLMAIAHVRLRQWAEAEAAFKEAMGTEQPGGFHVEYGKLLAERGRPQEAAAQFQQAIARSPDQIEAYVGLALVSVESRQWEEARKNALSALTLNSEIAICYYIVALADAQAGDPKKAIENCQLALKKNPDLTRAGLLQASLKSALGQNAAAEKEFAQLLLKEPDDPFIRRQLAVLLRLKGNYKAALEMLDPVAKAKPEDQQLQIFRFELLALAGQPRQAETVLNGMRSSLGRVRSDMASSWLADVEGDFTRAVSLIEPHLADRTGAVQWAVTHLKNGKEPGSWLPLLKHPLTAAEWSQMAVPAERQNLWAASAYCYQQALNLDPNNPALLNNWAWSAMNLKEFDKDAVLTAARRAYTALPKEPVVLDTYAEGLLRTGQSRECVDLLSANQAVTHRTPQLLLLLARAYESTSDLENSLRAYQQVLDLQARTGDWEVRMGKDALTQEIQKLKLKVN